MAARLTRRLSRLTAVLFFITFGAAVTAVGAAPTRPEDCPAVPQSGRVEKREEIVPGGLGCYSVSLKRGQLLAVEVRPEKADVVVGLLDGGNEIVRAADVTAQGEPEILLFEAGQDGQYTVVVLAPDYPERWAYRIALRVDASVSAADRKRLQAMTLMSDATQLATSASRERAAAKPTTAEQEAAQERADAETTRRLIDMWARSAQLWTEAGEKYWAGISSRQAGIISYRSGENASALSHFARAVDMQRQSGDRAGELWTVHDTAKIYQADGHWRKALELYQTSLALSIQLGDRSAEAHMLADIGKTYDDNGQREEAFEYISKGLAASRAIGDGETTALALNNLGALYVEVGELEKAAEALREAIPLWQAGGDRVGEGTTWHNLGAIYSELGKRKEAFDALGKALKLAEAEGYKLGQMNVLNSIAALSYEGGDYQTASANFQKSLALSREMGDTAGEALALSNLGLTYAHLGARDKTLEHLRQALLLQIVSGDAKAEVSTLNNLMTSWGELDEARVAAFYGKLSISRVQQLRGAIKGLDYETQKSFLRTQDTFFRNLIQLLLVSGRLPEALQVFNLFKDQEHFDFGAAAAREAAPPTLTPREAAAVARYRAEGERADGARQRLSEARGAYARQPSAEQAAQIKQLEAQLAAAAEGFAQTLAQTEKELSAAPEEDEDLAPDVPDAQELRAALQELGEKTGDKAAAIYTHITARSYYVLLVTPDDMAAARYEITSEELGRKAIRLWGLLQSDRGDPVPAARELYEVMLKPLEERLSKSGARTLLWSLDGPLRYVPMAALHDGKGYLVERFQNVVFTRANRERIMRATSPEWSGLGLGSSRERQVRVGGRVITFDKLPGVSRELAGIFRPSAAGPGVVRGRVLADEQFTAAGMLGELKLRRPLVHIASHFNFRPGDENGSFLLLGDGTTMSLAQMKQNERMFEGVELLTLSACQTAAQLPNANGREVDAMAELAQRLGANAVLATLWKVADDSTPRLMEEFYRLRQTGMTKAASLQQAQVGMLRGTRPAGAASPRDARTSRGLGRAPRAPARAFSHPYYWAPFVLNGNPR